MPLNVKQASKTRVLTRYRSMIPKQQKNLTGAVMEMLSIHVCCMRFIGSRNHNSFLIGRVVSSSSVEMTRKKKEEGRRSETAEENMMSIVSVGGPKRKLSVPI